MTEAKAPAATVAAPDKELVGLARRYAEALVDAAVKEGQADAAVQELDELASDVLARFPVFAQILASHRVSAAEKDRILSDVFQGRASDLVMRFLRVLNRHGRLELLAAAAREARILWDRRNRRIPVSVRSAVPLDDDQIRALSDRLRGLVAGTPVLTATIDPALIGGLVVQVGDLLYDGSVKSRLAQLRKRLIEGKTHEIQSRRDQFSYPA
ncbi:MAG: ATP synthase F1 subunit delta [Isosphaeraceae bacterium]